MAVYLDYNATTPVDPRVADAMEPFFRSHHGNPGSAHVFGSAARDGLQTARSQVARLIHAAPEQISFMSCATETINYVIRGVSAQCRRRGEHAHVITSASEHVAVLEACKHVEAYEGAQISVVGVHSDGRVDVEALAAALTERTALVSVMHANNEVGALNDVRAIVNRVRSVSPSALVHCDASQSVAKFPVDVTHLGVDFLTVAGHKLYAPKGVAALYTRDPAMRLPNLLSGGGQEGGLRAGTENVAFAVALGKACEIASHELPTEAVTLQARRDSLLAALERQVQGPHIVHGPHDPAHRLPTTLSISFPGVWASDVVSLLGTEVACSAGAACHAEGPPRVSHVLAAMGVEEEVAMGTLRLSVGRFTTEEEVERAASLLAEAVNERRSTAPAATPPTRPLFQEDSTLYFADAVVVRASEGPENGQVTLVTNATVFHPQGGGQPSDVGHVYLPSEHASLPVLLHVLKARWADGGVVEHICDIEIQDETPETDTLTAQHVVSLLPRGATVHQRVDENARQLHARLHSAGHLLDRAMELAGEELVPGKGYHFPDRPFVEYEGSVPAERRELLVEQLNTICRRLVAENAPTEVVVTTDRGELARLCGDQCSVDHLPEDSPVRVVTVAGQACPCGGTHVKRAGDIGSLVVKGLKVRKGKTQVKYELSP